MTAIDLIAYSREGSPEKRHSLPLDGPGARCSWRQRCLPGASAIHAVLVDRAGVRLRAEVPAEGGESVLLHAETDGEGGLSLSSAGRHVVTLPPDERYAPAAPIVPTHVGSLDLALVVDGTSRRFYREETEQARRITSRPLLDDPERWPAEVERLKAFLAALFEAHPEGRTAILAYGDHILDQAAAEDLRPQYLLHPADEESRALQTRTAERLQRELLAIPATSGADFVDAVAEALAACASLRWRPEARKLVLLFGDSPGHSVLHPGPQGGDLGVRELDVDTQAMRLQKRGVELATFYYDPPDDVGLDDLAARKELLVHARRQFRRLASLPELAFDASSFDPRAAAERISSVRGPIARGPALGELVEILPPNDGGRPAPDGDPAAAGQTDASG